MTVTYSADVATCHGFGCFLKLLGRWRASIYKLIWYDLLVFLCSYYVLSLTYRFLLGEHGKIIFESLVNYCTNYGSLIPLTFVLGFYVALVMKRWWGQYTTIPWPDRLAVYISAMVRGQDERGRVMRRTIMRYACLTLTMVFSMIAPDVKKRFPNFESLVDAGLLMDNERIILQNLDDRCGKYPNHWVPLVWAGSIITRTRREGRIWDDFSLKAIIDELNNFRGMCGALLHYDFISIPLVYTQVVTLTVYTYFLGAVIGQQWTEKMDTNGYWNLVGYYFPLFATLQFFFYMGWMKVAESLINPFGPDDDDFEVNSMIDRNLQVSYLIVDEMHHEHPELLKDQYWDDVYPSELPYPEGVSLEHSEPPEPSTAHINYIPKSDDDGTDRRIALSRIGSAMKGVFRRSLNSMNQQSFIYVSPSNQDSQDSQESHGSDKVKKVTQLTQPGKPEVDRTVTDDDESATKRTTVIVKPRANFQETSKSDSENDKDDFALLKEERDRERQARHQNQLVHSLSEVVSIVAGLRHPPERNPTPPVSSLEELVAPNAAKDSSKESL